MSARFSLGLLSSSRDFNRMQHKADNLYENYNYRSNCENISKTADLIQESEFVQSKLHRSMENIAVEAGSSCPSPCYQSCCYTYSSTRPCTSLVQASAAAACVAATTAAAVSNDLALRRSLNRKNAEICDLSSKYKRELSELESQLNCTRLNNSDMSSKYKKDLSELESQLNCQRSEACDLKSRLCETKKELTSERCRSSSLAAAKNADISGLKSQLKLAECELATLEPRAKLACELEKRICALKGEIGHVRHSNKVLADQNALQADILVRSRPASPCFMAAPCRTRSPSPCHSRSRSYSRPVSHCSRSSSRTRATSPISPNHCTQRIRQDLLVKRFDDLYSRDRLCAMDSLRTFSNNYENNQRVIFSSVQSAFNVAKKSFCDWKLRVRSTVAITHCGPDTLEEAVQCYINRNVDLYDLPSMVSEVILALNCNPKIRLPLGVSYSVISTFIREACRTGWEMSALAFPLDTAFALDAEVYEETRYRRSYDSDYGAPLVGHHIWPCLMQGLCVLARGEACSRRGASLYVRPSSPVRCSRNRTKSPCPKGILRSRSSYYCSN